LLRLKPDGQGMMVVGDDAQAIYSFRAATIRNILDFPDKFKTRPLAEHGNAEAQLNLGFMYANERRALPTIRRLAEIG
jgi:superfamily I DNA/RNA helicase